MKKLALLLGLALGITLAISSCKKEEEVANSVYFSRVDCTEADDTLNTYNGKIKTILDTHCAISSCHKGSNAKEGKDYSTYANAVSSFDGTLCAVYQEGSCEPMPDGDPKLSDADLHDLTCWAKNNFPQ